MKPVISVLLAFALASGIGPVLAQSQPAPPQSAPVARNILPFRDCIRTDQINEWHIVDTKTVIVRTGPYQRYLVNLQADCQWLGVGYPSISFIPNNSEKAMGYRICGQVGEKVRNRIQPPCGIQSVSLISEAQFNSYRAQAKYHSVRTQQPANNQKP
ncbi:DUF6491 family protein [Dyella psychrodurans]|uniref:Uncharacterized protein n=1 Tax=Dyella psychrodurans TaxID=1927960 RepID=A0A370XEM2_9GAMM|nr:DUF6491 family protein [Dyella psychrodurans]RDS86737.1 hypothetical protein DWU99_05780 [Dyella psychrodurans]